MKLDQFPQAAAPAISEATPSFSLFAAMSVAELAEVVPSAQRRGFHLAVGRRMAAVETLEGVSDASALCWRVNAFWHQLGWGEAEISLERDAIVVRHRFAPKAEGLVDDDAWSAMLLAVLEGAYDSWFRRLGSGPSLHTRAEWKGETVELRHGR
jgi:hypothetical protein